MGTVPKSCWFNEAGKRTPSGPLPSAILPGRRRSRGGASGHLGPRINRVAPQVFKKEKVTSPVRVGFELGHWVFLEALGMKVTFVGRCKSEPSSRTREILEIAYGIVMGLAAVVLSGCIVSWSARGFRQQCRHVGSVHDDVTSRRLFALVGAHGPWL